MAKIHKGDKVIIIAGKDLHKTGVVEKVFPKEDKLIITGMNMVKKHLKKSQKNPQGGIVDKTMPIHISNVMLLDPATNKPTRIGIKDTGKGKSRIAKVSGEMIKVTEKK